jgi:hypothetical protein
VATPTTTAFVLCADVAAIRELRTFRVCPQLAFAPRRALLQYLADESGGVGGRVLVSSHHAAHGVAPCGGARSTTSWRQREVQLDVDDAFASEK